MNCGEVRDFDCDRKLFGCLEIEKGLVINIYMVKLLICKIEDLILLHFA